MPKDMQQRQQALSELVEGNRITAGMYVRTRGDELILGRLEPVGPQGSTERDDRVKLTRLGADTYGISVRRHTGRWEKTPFTGSLEDMFDVVCGVMQHLVAAYP